MSTDSYLPSPETGEPVQTRRDHPTGPQPSGRPIDQELIQQTRDQIRQLVDEITKLAESDCSREEFFQGFLTRTIGALASQGGAIWRLDEAGGIRLEYQVNMSVAGLSDDEEMQRRHHSLLQQMAASAEAELIPPNSSAETTDVGNPTSQLLLIGPLKIDQRVVGLVEIFQRPDSGPTTQRGYLRFVVQMCRLASGYLKSHELRQFHHQQEMWQRLQQFVRAAFASLSQKETACAVANEGRRVIDCDRVSVALPKASAMRVAVMSGLDSIERRADQVKKLGHLVTAVVRGKQSLRYAGGDEDLPPQIEQHLQEYLDVAHVKLIAIEPLYETARDQDETTASTHGRRLVGALIVEQLGDDEMSPLLETRIEAVCSFSSQALSNAKTHSEMFLAPLWTRLGKSAAVMHARNLPKTAIALAFCMGLLAALWWVPYPFTLSTSGQLVPETQHEIFAQVDGVLQQIMIPADPDDIVHQGQLIAVMTNNDLMIEINDLNGQLNQLSERVRKLQRAQHGKMDPIEHRIVEGDLAEAIQTQQSVREQLKWAMQKYELLQIKAPASGRVVNWQVRQHLLRRPVLRGQNLMTIVPPQTPWQIELELPEKRVNHLMKTMGQQTEPTVVSFTLASHPGNEFRGRVQEVGRKLEVRGDSGNSLRILVEFDESDIPAELLRAGTRVTAKVHAGKRSLGYVWFHELTETIQQTWLMWF